MVDYLIFFIAYCAISIIYLVMALTFLGKYKHILDRYSNTIIILSIFGQCSKIINQTTTFIYTTQEYDNGFWEAFVLMYGNAVNSIYFLVLHIFVFKMVTVYYIIKAETGEKRQNVRKKITCLMYCYCLLYGVLTVSVNIFQFIYYVLMKKDESEDEHFFICVFMMIQQIVKGAIDLIMLIFCIIIVLHFRNLRRMLKKPTKSSSFTAKKSQRNFCIRHFATIILVSFMLVYIIRFLARDIFFSLFLDKEMQALIHINYDDFFLIIKGYVQPIHEILDLINGILILFLFHYFGKQDETKKHKVSNRLSGMANEDKDKRASSQSSVTDSTGTQSNHSKEIHKMSLYQDKSVYYAGTEERKACEENICGELNNTEGNESLFEEEIEDEFQDGESSKDSMLKSLMLENQEIRFTFTNNKSLPFSTNINP